MSTTTENNNEQEGAAEGGAGVVKKTISLPRGTYDRGVEAAKAAHRNFSNYVATLIEGDGKRAEGEEAAPATT